MVDDLLRKLQYARYEAEKIWPYISSVLFELRLVRVDDPQFTTLGVDSGWRLYWSPGFVEKCAIPELATSLLHECMHCLLEHAERFDELDCNVKDHSLWNIVGDCSINETLDEQALILPKHIRPFRFEDFNGEISKDDTTERNYFKLLDFQTAKKKSDDGQAGQPGSGDGEPTAGEKETDSAGEDAPNESPNDLGSPDCGSIAGGDARWYELDDEDSSAPAIDSATKTVATTNAVGAILSGGSWGGGAGAGQSLRRSIEELLKPRVSWKKKLAMVLRQTLGNVMGRTDYTLTRISRREHTIKTKDFSPRLPAMRGPLPPNVAVIIDTSPSITDRNINDALTEVIGIVRAVGASRKVAVIPCSYNAYGVQYVRTPKQVEYIRLDGDEGTDLTKGFTAAMNLKQKPEIIVVITDGETPWPDHKPKGVRLVLVLLNNKSGQNSLKPWMVPIVLEN